MSTIAERARNEADEAEREDEDAAEAGETGETPEPEPEPEPTPEDEPVTEARLKKIGKAIEGEDTRHEKRLREIYGDLWGERETCPLCLQEGFVSAVGAGEFDPEQRMAVLSVMGDTAAPTFEQNPKLHTCEQCKGQGMLATGSKRDGFTDRACFKCDGNGFIDSEVEQAMRGIQTYPPPAAAPVPANGPALVNSDTWGRPFGHPHWGQDPANVGVPVT
jgi:hypothetical protein